EAVPSLTRESWLFLPARSPVTRLMGTLYLAAGCFMPVRASALAPALFLPIKQSALQGLARPSTQRDRVVPLAPTPRAKMEAPAVTASPAVMVPKGVSLWGADYISKAAR